MGHWSGLSDERGSISGEAAIGIAVIVMVTLMLAQALGVGMWQLTAHATLAEAVRVATASGEPEVQLSLAREMVQSHFPQARLAEDVDAGGVRFELRQRFVLPGIGWRPLLVASSAGLWQDSWQN